MIQCIWLKITILIWLELLVRCISIQVKLVLGLVDERVGRAEPRAPTIRVGHDIVPSGVGHFAVIALPPSLVSVANKSPVVAGRGRLPLMNNDTNN